MKAIKIKLPANAFRLIAISHKYKYAFFSMQIKRDSHIYIHKYRYSVKWLILYLYK